MPTSPTASHRFREASSPWSRSSRAGVAGLCCLLATVGNSQATWQGEIQYSRLKAELGSSTPDGTGIDFAQVESASAGRYLAAAGSSNPISGTGDLSGKLIYDRSQSNSSQSTHAETVARNICNNRTGPNLTSSSIAPAINEFDAWEADDWLNSQIKYTGNSEPGVETRDMENHSWIGSTGSNSSDNSILRRLDYLIERDNTLVFVGVNNDASNPVPALLSSAYNVISVGVSDGDHSHGGTPSGIDGPGRFKPEIVAPHNVTSYATGRVTGASSLLLQTIDGDSALVNARNPEAFKAILMAGASKSEFPGWSRTTTQPLDNVRGAGELDIYNSYHILTGGEQAPDTGTSVGTHGWDFETHTASSLQSYTFEVPPGYKAGEVSVLMTWHRTITDTAPGNPFNPSPSLEDLDLELYASVDYAPTLLLDSSVSSDHNLEHIYQTELASGQYTIQVTGSGSREYGLAWRVDLVPLIDVADIAAGEGDGSADILVTLPSPHRFDVSFDYATGAGSAADGPDFSGASGNAMILKGETSVLLPILISDDSLDELQESFVVNLSNAQGTDLLDDSAVITIEDNDAPPQVSVTGPASVDEAAGLVMLSVDLNTPSGLDVTVSLDSADASAESPGDYLATAALLIIPAGTTSVPLSLSVNDDSDPEANETLSLVLSNAGNASLPPSPFVLTVIDDDVGEDDMDLATLAVDFSSDTATFQWKAIPGRIYTIEASVDLTTWVAIPSATNIVATSVLESAQDTEILGVRTFYRAVDVTLGTSAP